MSTSLRISPDLGRGLIVAACVLLASCASFSRDHGFTNVQSIVSEKLPQKITLPVDQAIEQGLTAKVENLLQQPLDVESAVQVALFNNKDLQASYQQLGLAEADLVQAGRLPNPRFSMLYARNSGDYKIEQALTLNIFALATMPKAREIEQRRFLAIQKEVALDVLKLAAETRKAYFTAVAAEETVRYMQQVNEAAEASAELAKRMAKAGNWSKLDQAREQGFYADATLEYARAINERTATRERLGRLLALNSAQQRQLQLAQRLPDLPAQPEIMNDLEQTAMQQRLDLQIVRLNTEALAKQLGLTKATRLVNVLELGPARVLEGPRSEPYKNGVEIAFELPLFDWGESRVVRAEARYMQALNQAAQLAINAQSEVRQYYAGYRANYDITRHYRDEIVPIRKRISSEYQLRYNGMLVSVFDLLADAKAQVSSVNQYIQSLRDFWIAQSALQMSLIGGSRQIEREF